MRTQWSVVVQLTPVIYRYISLGYCSSSYSYYEKKGRYRLGKLTYSHLRAIFQWNTSAPSLFKDCPNILRTHDLLPGPSAWLAKLTPWLWTAGFSESPRRKNRHLSLLQCIPSSLLCAAKMIQDHLVLLYIKGWLRKNGRPNAICAFEMLIATKSIALY